MQDIDNQQDAVLVATKKIVYKFCEHFYNKREQVQVVEMTQDIDNHFSATLQNM
jgi:hypothetical protein